MTSRHPNPSPFTHNTHLGRPRAPFGAKLVPWGPLLAAVRQRGVREQGGLACLDTNDALRPGGPKRTCSQGATKEGWRA